MHLSRRAFTLLEAVVVIAIAGVLTGLLLVAVAHARLVAARARCQNHLKQLGLAVLNYEAAHGVLPPAAVCGPYAPLGVPDGVSHGLWAFVLPHLDEGARAARYRWDVPCDDPANGAVTATPIPVLQCPASDGERFADAAAAADYGPVDVGVVLLDLGLLPPGSRPDGPLPANCPARLNDITDGTSTTVLLTEGAGGAWASPGTRVPARLVVTGGAFHPGGLNVGMADGSVRAVPLRTDPAVVARLLTRAGGEPVPGDF